MSTYQDTYEETYYYSEEDKQNKKNPVILTLTPSGKVPIVTHVTLGRDAYKAKLEKPMPIGMYLNDLDLIKEGGNTMAKGGRRSKKQRKSVRKLRRRNASRKNDNRKK
jgi:hypothetical protein